MFWYTESAPDSEIRLPRASPIPHRLSRLEEPDTTPQVSLLNRRLSDASDGAD